MGSFSRFLAYLSGGRGAAICRSRGQAASGWVGIAEGLLPAVDRCAKNGAWRADRPADWPACWQARCLSALSHFVAVVWQAPRARQRQSKPALRENLLSDHVAPTVLITGAAQRIGRVLAGDFAARGWQVAIHYHASRQQAEALAAELGQGGTPVAVLAADLRVAREVDGLVPECCRVLGPPTCLINNAATFAPDAIATLGSELWDAQLAVNLKAPVFLAKAFARRLPTGVAGNIINIIDQGVLKPTPQFFSYSASKAGLWAVTRTLAQALAPQIRVNAIGPGPVLQSTHQTEAQFRAEYQATLLGRRTDPAEIAAAIRFILQAPALTGQMLALDGGQHLLWRTADVTSPGS